MRRRRRLIGCAAAECLALDLENLLLALHDDRKYGLQLSRFNSAAAAEGAIKIKHGRASSIFSSLPLFIFRARNTQHKTPLGSQHHLNALIYILV
jgi:hypothetical protein